MIGINSVMRRQHNSDEIIMKKWSRKYDCCQECGITEIPHGGNGLCRKCYIKAHYQKYREEYIERSRKFYQKRRERCKEYKRKYMQSSKYKTVRKRYLQSPKGKQCSQNCCRKRRAAKYEVNYWLPFYDLMWQWAKELTFGYCPYCGNYIGVDQLTQDHIIPMSKGGIHSVANVQPLCLSCNDKKGNKSLFEGKL